MKKIDVSKTSKSKESDICYYWCFLDNGFNFQPQFCNGCHDLFMVSISLSNIAIINIKGADYRCIINGISKSEAMKLMQNIDLTEKRKTI